VETVPFFEKYGVNDNENPHGNQFLSEGIKTEEKMLK